MAKHRYTKKQKIIVEEWGQISGFEFMEPYDGEPFREALQRNLDWFEHKANDVSRVGANY